MKVTFLQPKMLYTIRTEEGTYLQHYDSVVAFRPSYDSNRTIELGVDWDYSRTTMKHIKQFIGTTASETRVNIESGKYILNEKLSFNTKTYKEIK